MPSTPLAPGARVLVRDEEWVVRRTDKATPGGRAVHCVGLSELVRGKEAIFLTDLDEVTELAPEKTALVHDDSPLYRRTRLFLEAQLRRTPPPAGDDRIYLGHRAAIREAPYQLAPAAKALRQERPRLLIADGVGLGKTIEAGILLTELIERGRGRRILVVALKSILAQFQKELWARFTIPLVRLDSVGIQRVQARIPSSMNPFHYYDRVIVSIDTLKKDAKYRRYLEQCRWDAIVIDECQNVADRGGASGAGSSQRANLARLLARTTDALILTSATPHDGRAESFATILQLLDPTAVADPTDLRQEDVRHLYVRRFKKHIAHEVGDAFRDRILDPQHVDASPAEDAVFACLAGLQFRTIQNGGKRGSADAKAAAAAPANAAAPGAGRGMLFRTLLLKAFLSSPAACAATVAERLRKLEAGKVQAPAADVAHDVATLRRLHDLCAAVDDRSFGKYQRLLAHLRGLGVGKKGDATRVVIFSERIDTLDWLAERLARDLKLGEDQLATFHGTLDDQEQIGLVQRFGVADSRLRVLLASDAASEGLNLHYQCCHLVHFDLPWSLITLEQRNGRIDRYGQERQPVLTYLLTRPGDATLRGDLRVLDVLVQKEDVAHRNLGDAAWLLQLHDAAREEEHIGKGIEAGAPAEQVLPDPGAEDDLLKLLLGDGEDPAERAGTAQDPSLYPDDLGYFHDALAMLGTRRDDLQVERLDHLQGLVLQPPADLQHRLSYLPPELLQERAGKDPVLRLTTDRKRVMDALDAARRSEGAWPEWQLLWEQHPVCEWLDDALLAAFDRHEAPVLRLARGLAADERVFLVQGQLTNHRGQPQIVEWFGVPFHGAAPAPVRPFAELVAATGLDRGVANPGTPPAPDLLAALRQQLPVAVERARAHMEAARRDRAARLSEGLRNSQARLEDWCRRRLERIERRRQEAGRTLSDATQKRLAAEARDVEAIRSERREWLQDGVLTHPTPYLRIAAVLVRA